jgi:hypothetical protein
LRDPAQSKNRAAFRPWEWGLCRFDWGAHLVFINSAPWGRLWANRAACFDTKRHPHCQYVLQDLGRYTPRVAISNHRLVLFTNGQVTSRWRDSAHNNEQKLMTLALDEFLRRFLLHLLPKGFVRIRLFGLLANRRRSSLPPLCFAALGAVPMQIEAEAPTQDSDPLWLCPNCGGPMKVIERLTAAQIQLRSPPRLLTTAT